MANEKFNFSPRFKLALDHLPLLRQIYRVFEEEGPADRKLLLRYLSAHLQNAVPELAGWNSRIEDSGLFFWPGNDWDTEGDDGIALAVELKNFKSPAKTDGDPWIGVYVPETWKPKRKFKERLRAQLKGSAINEWDGPPEDEWPIWNWVNALDYSEGDTFSTEAFMSAIELRIKNLTTLRPVIDKVIKEIGKE